MTLKSKIKSQLLWLKSGLYQHYTVKPEIQFKSLRQGFIIFGLGLAAIMSAHTSIEPSLKQEVIVLIGICITTIGFILAMKSYIRIIISRIILFIKK